MVVFLAVVGLAKPLDEKGLRVVGVMGLHPFLCPANPAWRPLDEAPLDVDPQVCPGVGAELLFR